MKKVPEEVFLLEKDHLFQMPQPLINTINTSSSIYFVRKNNIISYKQNRYQLPKDKPYIMPNLNTKPITEYVRPEIRNIDEYLQWFQKDDKKWIH